MATPWMEDRWIAHATNHFGSADVRRILAGCDLLQFEAAQLPAASQHNRQCAWLTDTEAVVVSDGTTWQRLDNGDLVG